MAKDIRPKINRGKYTGNFDDSPAYKICKMFQSGAIRLKEEREGHFPETSESHGYQALKTVEEYRRDIGDMERI